MPIWLAIFAYTSGALLAGAVVLHLIPRLGPPGRRFADALARAPLLDLMITYFTAAPMIVGAIVGARTGGAGGTWWGALYGFLSAVGAQIVAVNIWTIAHELANPRARRGPRIVTTINRAVGPARNFTAVWVTALAVPLFWIIRVAEYVVYPPLTVLVRFPRYKAGDWVNCSRHKFEGLVGHDLIWCLYCDWMTRIWSLGSEMLRNVESFWCPIRFHSEKKCENCRTDFPDIDAGWVPADASMGDVTSLLAEKYPPSGTNTWYGHPARLTVEGETPPEPDAEPGRGPAD